MSNDAAMEKEGFLTALGNIGNALWGNVPTCDKVLGVLGASGATIAAGVVSEYLGWMVAAATVFMVIPRGILNWRELVAERRKRRDARIRASRALSEAEKIGEGYEKPEP